MLRSVLDILGFVLYCLFVTIKSICLSLLPDRYKKKVLKGEIAVITGGGGGLGRLVALRLARLEVTVVLWDVNAEAVQEAVKLITSVGGTAHGFKCDLTNKEEVYKIAKRTQLEVGEVSILINNAGVVSGSLLLETPDNLIKRTFDVNVLAHFWTTKAFMPEMINKNHGHIVNIVSMAGLVGTSKLVDYCSSKFAALGFDEALKVELESLGIDGVKTTAICPYFIQSTGMFENVNSRFINPLKSNDVADRIVDAILKEEHLVLIPAVFRYMLVLKLIFPWACSSMFLRGLIPDAAPTDPQPKVFKTEESLTKMGLLQNSMESIYRNTIAGKNL